MADLIHFPKNHKMSGVGKKYVERLKEEAEAIEEIAKNFDIGERDILSDLTYMAAAKEIQRLLSKNP